MVAAGTLRNRIRIEQRADGATADGQPLDDWVLHAEVWADFRAPTGMGLITGEFVAADREVSRVQYSVRIRCRATVTAGMRVVHRGTVFEIRQVVHDIARSTYTDLVVAEGANNG